MPPTPPTITRPRQAPSATTTPAHRHRPYKVVLALAALLALFVVGLTGAGDAPATARSSVRGLSVAAHLVPAQPSPVPPPDATCVLTDLGGCVSGAVDAFLRDLVADALNPLLTMLSDTLLTTPSLDQLPGLRQLWGQSWQIVLAAYGLLVLLAGILIMGYETV